LNLFIALLLSLFNSEKLESSNEDDENKMKEAKERIIRWFNFVCQKLSEIECMRKIFRKNSDPLHNSINEKKHISSKETLQQIEGKI